jgi:hypothetical protein
MNSPYSAWRLLISAWSICRLLAVRCVTHAVATVAEAPVTDPRMPARAVIV